MSSYSARGYAKFHLATPEHADILQERETATRNVKQERGIKREHDRERSGTIADDSGDEISVVSMKRRREQYRTTVDENGVEAIDLT